jgi:hypothetical protein
MKVNSGGARRVAGGLHQIPDRLLILGQAVQVPHESSAFRWIGDLGSYQANQMRGQAGPAIEGGRRPSVRYHSPHDRGFVPGEAAKAFE